MKKMGKAKSLNPPMPIVTPTNNSVKDAQFELELCWCLQQLETALNSGKLSQKVVLLFQIAEDTVKNIKVLKGNSAPLIRKRQIMKTSMGDYRAKMKEEEKKMALASKQIKFTPTAETVKKSSFVKKSSILTSGKDFKFNFDTTMLRCNDTKEQALEITQRLDTNNLQLTAGKGFMFNFAINEENNEIQFGELSIK